MQSKSNEEVLSTSVISIFSKKIPKDDSLSAKTEDDADAQKLFEDIQKRNREVEERMRKERVKANRAVLRSYRIKT